MRNMVTTSKKKRYFIGILVLALIISVAFNLYDYFVVLPKMQATANDLRVGAFGSWLGEMLHTARILQRAETKEDFRQAEIRLDNADLSVAMLLTGIDMGYYPEQNLYHRIGAATRSLTYAVEQIWTLLYYNSSALDQYIRLRIENITQATYNMGTTVSDSQIAVPWVNKGVELVQQLQDKGKLTDVMNYCKQIQVASVEIANYVYDKLQLIRTPGAHTYATLQLRYPTSHV